MSVERQPPNPHPLVGDDDDRIAVEEIARGDVRSFDDVDAAIEWLCSDAD